MLHLDLNTPPSLSIRIKLFQISKQDIRMKWKILNEHTHNTQKRQKY